MADEEAPRDAMKEKKAGEEACRGSLFEGKIDFPSLVLASTHNSLNFSNTGLATEINGNYISQLEIGDIIKKPFGNLPLKSIHKKPSHQFDLLSPRPMGSTPLPASAKSIGVAGCNGRQQVTVEEYFNRIRLDKPDVVIALADEAAWHMSSKRLRTAVERTLLWFAELQSFAMKEEVTSLKYLFAVVVGGTACSRDQIERQIIAYISGGASGLLIGGVGQGESLEERKNFIMLVREISQGKLPIMMQGLDTLPEILHAISCRVDILSSDYPRVLSSVGFVLNCDFQVSTDLKNSEDSTSAKRQKLSKKCIDGSEILNLWDPKFRKDTSAILSGCSCHCCRLYTRAYLHHLLLSHELLADAMIYVHNRHVLLELFDAARGHVRDGNEVEWINEIHNM